MIESTRVNTPYRTIVSDIPHPDTIPVIEELRQIEPRSMDGMPPIVWDRAEGSQVWDRYGNKWIDFSSAVVLTNAGHATPKGGKIVARTYLADESAFEGESDGAGAEEVARNMVILEVDDTGTGIPNEQSMKLYDPFFTTKPKGKGTGLGLSVTRQIVDMHGGKIDIRNRDNGGARVTVGFYVPEEATDGGQEAHSAG